MRDHLVNHSVEALAELDCRLNDVLSFDKKDRRYHPRFQLTLIRGLDKLCIFFSPEIWNITTVSLPSGSKNSSSSSLF